MNHQFKNQTKLQDFRCLIYQITYIGTLRFEKPIFTVDYISNRYRSTIDKLIENQRSSPMHYQNCNTSSLNGQKTISLIALGKQILSIR